MTADRRSIIGRKPRRTEPRFRATDVTILEHPPAALLGPNLSLATYNLHRCVGVDRRYDPGRIASVLRELNADIVGLQEVETRRHGQNVFDQCAFLAEAAGLFAVSGPHLVQYRARFSNALLTRLPVLRSGYIDLSINGCPPRGALDVDLDAGNRVLRVIATHLGLGGAERKQQTERLLAILAETQAPQEDAVLIMGDLNEWRGRRGGILALDHALGR